MVLSPTEETPRVEGAEDKDFEEETQRSKVGGFQKYLFGFILIVAGLNGAYFLGKATSSDSGNNNNHDVVVPSYHHQRSSSTTSPPRRTRHGDQNEDDDFVRLDDDDDDDETMDTSHNKNNDDDCSGDDGRVKYIGTQFISFTINTMGGLSDEGECEGHVVSSDGKCYLGNPHNNTDDVHHRLAIVKHVVGKLKEDSFNQNHDIDHADDVLKIVMFPEFFWRDQVEQIPGHNNVSKAIEFWCRSRA